MVVDSSVVVAVLKDEDDADAWSALLEASAGLVISAANYVEVVMVVAGRQATPHLGGLDDFLRNMDMQIVPVTATDALLARDAFVRFGKGRHRARLNYGDCFAYALAQRLGEPLLFKGDDFVHTDVLRL